MPAFACPPPARQPCHLSGLAEATSTQQEAFDLIGAPTPLALA
ncbi:MAG TPA: hypothetical protein VN969_32140 [Streptosporangiaceae bacterium]|nr:hypothetical protein [Streptosporangiaceae bacterium]